MAWWPFPISRAKAMSFLHNLRIALALVWQAAPAALCLAIISNLLVSSIPTLLLYLNAQLLEQLTTNMASAVLISLLLPYLLLSGFQDSFSLVANFSVDTLRDALSMHLKQRVNTMIATFPDLSIHENPALRETAILASRASEEISDLLLCLYAVASRIFMTLPLLLLLGQTAWWIPLLLLAGMLPVLLVRAQAESKSWDVQAHHAATFNELRILDRILTQPDFAKDLRTFRMQVHLMARWRGLYQGYLDKVKQVRMLNVLKLAASSMFACICLGLPLHGVITGYQQGRFSIAQLAFLLGALVQMKDSLAIIIYNFGDMLRASHCVIPFGKLLALHQEKMRPAPPAQSVIAQSGNNHHLVLEKIRFSYQDSTAPVLDDINLTIHPREVIALVGDNGAGKSTLLKILSGLYQPTGGQLHWNSRHTPPRVITVFQDFSRFPLTVSENLVVDDPLRRAECLTAVGLSCLVDKTDIPLSAEIPAGIDLSGGQWQRLAIARAMAHADEADLLLFDEPTSALDPESEAGIMQGILQLSRQKTAIIASHRLALTRFVDRIVVLHQGSVVEQGPHDQLMALNGKYARMFQQQAMYYQDQRGESSTTD